MFQNKPFLGLLGNHLERHAQDGVLEDVWDGKIWNEFKSDPTDHTKPFLSNKNNLGLLINVDWFKPFKRSEYKVAALMLTVLNLPRQERFRKKWTMIVGIIPGPSEPKLHINSFLKPLVDDLLNLWKGLPLLKDGSMVRAALLGVAADMPAARKVSQFLGHKADLGCNKCYFRAEREPGTTGASGRMSYYTSTPSTRRSMVEVKSQAKKYKDAKSKAEADRIQKQHGLRWSELIRLPYFDLSRMITIDPMHTFLLGMVKDECENHVSNESTNPHALSGSKRSEFFRRMKTLKVPYDIGRLPSNMKEMNSLSGLTAEQMKNFAIVYARACFKGLIPDTSYRVLCLLCNIVTIICQPILTEDNLTCLYRLLHDHHTAYCRFYGKFRVTVNYHMALHMPEVILDYGPPHAFWCFAYERMNGILASTPTNNRGIENEVLDRFLLEFTFNQVELNPLLSPYQPVLKELIEPQAKSSSFSQVKWAVSMFYAEPEDRFEMQQIVDKGEVDQSQWSMIFMHPKKLNVLMDREFLQAIKDALEALYGDCVQYVSPRINKYARYSVNGQVFSSNFNSTDRGSIVKALTDQSLHPYFGIVNFFFDVDAIIDSETRTCSFAYVFWFKFCTPSKESISQLYMVKKTFYSGDHIVSPRRFLSRCVLLAPCKNENYYFVCELPK